MKIRTFRPKTNKNKQPQPRPDNPKPRLNAETAKSRPNTEGAKLRFIPLGGIGDVTKNMYVYEYEDDIIILDCGVGFPETDMPGVDLVIPDISYLRDKVSRIKGIVITHGHDDHIGGLPYIWPELKCPIYTQKLTAGLIRAKFAEHNLPKDVIKALNPEDIINLGKFQIGFYRITHSIPDTVGVVINTPEGLCIHQSDFKIDWTPVIGDPPDIGRMATLGNSGVIFMTMDCLRVEKTGYTLSERMIEPTFAEVEAKTAGKVLITMTSSNVSRIQQAINVAAKSGRKLALSGRSLETNFQVARDLGYFDIPPNLLIHQEETKRFPDNKLMVLIAGSQGQPGSSLSRAAHGDHKYISLDTGDAVIFSADPIPSTETAQATLIDTLSRAGVDVYYSAITSDLHVSGHAAQEELKLMLRLLRPQTILPIGGQYRHMRLFRHLAEQLGFEDKQIIHLDNGSVVNITKQGAKVSGSVEVSNVYVDGLGVGDVGNVVLRDRQTLSEEGVVVVVVPVHRQTGALEGQIDIITRGFIYEKESEDLIDSSREIVKSLFEKGNASKLTDWRYLRNRIEQELGRFYYQTTNRRPMILPMVVDL